MDNLTHTLTGFVLARAGIGRRSALATTALVVGSNLPDIDLAWSMGSDLAYFHLHRGWTHSFAGVALLVATLWLALWGIGHRLRLPVRAGPLATAVLAGVASHFAMDAMNPYGIRPFLPWSDRWVHVDAWFIIDPWLWLLLGATLAAEVEAGRWPRRAWAAAAAVAAMIVLLAPGLPMPVRFAWCGTTLLTAIHRVVSGPTRRGPRLARRALALIVSWGIVALVGNQLAVRRLHTLDQSPDRLDLAALPRPAEPLRYDGIVRTPDRLRLRMVAAHPLLETADVGFREVETRLDEPHVRALAATCPGQVALAFFRFPVARSRQEEDGRSFLLLRDARFGLELPPRFGYLEVPILPDGTPDSSHLPCP